MKDFFDDLFDPVILIPVLVYTIILLSLVLVYKIF